MFYDNFLNLCAERRESPSGVARKIGLSNAAANGWKNGKMPSEVTLTKLAQYFNITTDRLLADKQKETAPTLTKKDERDIAKDLERIMNDLEHSEDLMFDGKPMSEDSIESLRAAMKLGLEAVKLKNKETYTPKKYRKNKGD